MKYAERIGMDIHYPNMSRTSNPFRDTGAFYKKWLRETGKLKERETEETPQYLKLENDRGKENGNWTVLKREIEEMPQYHKLENDRWKETGNWAVLKREIEKTLPNT